MTRRLLLCGLAVAGLLVPAQPASAAAELQAPRSIVFARTTWYGTHIFKVEPDGSGLVRLTSGSSRDTEPAWDPYGTAVAYTRRSDGRTDVWKVGSDGSAAHEFIPNARSLTWSEDGTMVAFVRVRNGNTDVWRANEDGSNRVRLTTGTAWDAEPSWTMDGRILFTSDRSGRHRIHVMSPTGTDVERLTSGPGSQRDAVWHAVPFDTVVYEQHVDGRTDIYRTHVNGGTPEVEVAGAADERDPAVAFLGELVFQRVRRDGSSVLVSTWLDSDLPLTVLPAPAGSTNAQPGWVPSLAWIEAQDDQAKANAVEAAGTAQAIRDAEGSFEGAHGTAMEAANPSLEYVTEAVDSTNPITVSIRADGATWAGAVLSDSGLCFWIRLEDAVATKYGLASASTCGGTDATGAIHAEW